MFKMNRGFNKKIQGNIDKTMTNKSRGLFLTKTNKIKNGGTLCRKK